MGTLVTWDEFTASGRPQGETIGEIVLAEVTNLISKRRPLMSVLSAGGAKSTFIEQLTDSLNSRAHNAVIEGIAYTDYDLTQPSRHFVHVQSFYKSGRVSDEQRMTHHYNGDPLAYQIGKSLNELLNDVEHALHRGSAATGATNAARQFKGLLNIFSGQSGTATYTSSSGTTFTEEVLVDLLQVFRDSKLDVEPTIAFVSSWLKRTISEFSTRVTRNVDVAAKKQTLVVEQHESDFGTLNVMYSEDQLHSASKTTYGNSVSFIDPALFKVGWMKAPTVEQLARDGLRDRYQINGQVTLLYDHEKGGGGGDGFVPYINQA